MYQIGNDVAWAHVFVRLTWRSVNTSISSSSSRWRAPKSVIGFIDILLTYDAPMMMTTVSQNASREPGDFHSQHYFLLECITLNSIVSLER
jgi:hypothetical protein